MKRVVQIVASVAIVIGLGMGAYAWERASAMSETAEAMDTIAEGLDWDGESKITPQQQVERMEANAEMLRSQKSQRTTSGLLSMALIAVGAAGFVVGPRFLPDSGEASAEAA